MRAMLLACLVLGVATAWAGSALAQSGGHGGGCCPVAEGGANSATGAGGDGTSGTVAPNAGGGGGSGVTGGAGGSSNSGAAGGTGASVAGGNGGAGSDGSNGGGGGGGAHGSVVTTTSTNSSTLTGGNGGAGGSGSVGGGGGAGAGGYGVVINSSGITYTNSGTIEGGAGGIGGNGTTLPTGNAAGAGGSGGYGINAATTGNTIVNAGSIIGGSGGDAGQGSFRTVGPGGAGIIGGGLTITNSGSISGGPSGDGTTRANAITFAGGTNLLELQPGSLITGNVVAFSTADTLRLGGSGSASFDVSQIGAGAQYQNFGVFAKTGSSTWTLTGTTAATTPWAINGGTLAISADGNLGAASGGLSVDGGSLATTATFGMARTTTLNAGGGTVDVAAGTTLTMSGAIGGAGALTKVDTGTLVLTGANTYAGSTTINAGTLTYSGAASSSGGGNLNVATAAGNVAVVNFNSSGTRTFNGAFNVGASGGAGAVNQTAGAVNALNNAGYIEIGNGAAGTYGSYVLSGGSLTTTSASGIRVGDGTGGIGIFTQTGGALSLSRFFAVAANAAGEAPVGIATFTGGTATVVPGFQFLVGDSDGTGVLNLGTQAGGTAVLTSQNSGGVQVTDGNHNTGSGTLNLDSGTLNQTAGSITKAGAAGATAVVNFNGGTLRAGANNLTLINNTLNSVNVYNGGAVFDTNGFTATVAANLRGTAGNGVYPAGGTLTLGAGGGAGYIGAPSVKVTGGSGSGAMAIANLSGGVVTGVTLTNPGQNYQAGDTLTFSFTGGGASTVASPFPYTLTASDVATNISGGVTKVGAGTLVVSGTNTYTGGTNLNAGTITVANNSALGTGTLTMAAGTALSWLSGNNYTVGNGIALTGDPSFAPPAGTTQTLTGVISDGSSPGTLEMLGPGTLILTAANTYTGGTTISAGTLQLGNGGTSGSVVGNVTDNGTLAFNRSDTLTFGGVISGSGAVNQIGTGTTILTGANTYSGGTLISAGTLQLGNGGTSGSTTGNVTNNATLAFNRSDNVTFGGVISGSGAVNQTGSGSTILTAANTYTGATNVNAGALYVNGNQSAATGATTVASGATLGGTGTIGGSVTVASGATLAPGNPGIVPGTLTINGNLGLSSGSIVSYRLAQGGSGPTNDLVVVNGNLTLAGTLNVTVASGGTPGPGVSRVFDYAGTLTNNGLALGTVPGPGYLIQTSVPNQVNLINTGGATLTFWDGGAAANKNNGVVDGGSGTWQSAAGNDNWTGANGAANAPWTNGAFAIFDGAPGTVTVDNGVGQVTASGLQFTVNGYTVTGGPITLTETTAGSGQTTIDVGDDTSAGASITATIGSVLQGTTQLVKTDLGTLILTGANTYTGGTAINGGTLQVSSDANLGAASGGLSFGGGTLATTASFGTARITTLNAGGGTLDVAPGTTLTMSGPIGGAGALTKVDTGILILTGANTYSGGTTISAGTLQLGNGGTTGSIVGNVVNNGTLVFNRSDSVTFSGVISGTGAINQTGPGTTTLTGNSGAPSSSPFSSGPVTVSNGGTLVIASPTQAAVISSTSFAINGASALVVNAVNREDVQGTFTFDSVGGGTVNFTGTSSFGGVVLSGNMTITANGGAPDSVISTTGFGLNLNGSNFENVVTLNTATSGSTLLVSSRLWNVGDVTKTGPGTATLTFANIYTGITTISGGILSTPLLANGGAASGIGNSSNAAGNLVLDGGTLQYTGGAVSTDRLFTLTTNGGGLDASGSGPLTFSNSGSVALGGSGARTLTLTGINTGPNTFASALGDNGGATSLAKSGVGTWVLGGTNTYSGGTAINGGTLQVSSDANLGAASGGLSFNGGTLATTASFGMARATTLNAGADQPGRNARPGRPGPAQHRRHLHAKRRLDLRARRHRRRPERLGQYHRRGRAEWRHGVDAAPARHLCAQHDLHDPDRKQRRERDLFERRQYLRLPDRIPELHRQQGAPDPDIQRFRIGCADGERARRRRSARRRLLQRPARQGPRYAATAERRAGAGGPGRDQRPALRQPRHGARANGQCLPERHPGAVERKSRRARRRRSHLARRGLRCRMRLARAGPARQVGRLAERRRRHRLVPRKQRRQRLLLQFRRHGGGPRLSLQPAVPDGRQHRLCCGHPMGQRLRRAGHDQRVQRRPLRLVHPRPVLSRRLGGLRAFHRHHESQHLDPGPQHPDGPGSELGQPVRRPARGRLPDRHAVRRADRLHSLRAPAGLDDQLVGRQRNRCGRAQPEHRGTDHQFAAHDFRRRARRHPRRQPHRRHQRAGRLAARIRRYRPVVLGAVRRRARQCLHGVRRHAAARQRRARLPGAHACRRGDRTLHALRRRTGRRHRQPRLHRRTADDMVGVRRAQAIGRCRAFTSAPCR
jgi:fibronectin-binding autotransporter adhesin